MELAEEIDLGIVVAFGQIIKTELLTKIPLVNIHFSLLPRWRGAAPVERAILAGDKETGVCLMAVAKGLDTGDVYASQKIKIDDTVTAAELRLILTDLGIKMLTDKLSKIPDDAYLNGGKSPGGEEMLRRYFGEPIKQEGEATYAAKIGPEDLKIIWENQTSAVLRQIRLAKAWTVFRGERLIIHDAMMYSVKNVSEHVSEDILTKENDILADSIPGTISRSGLIVTGDGLIKVRKLQSSGRAVLDFDNWSAGIHLKDGERLGI